MRLESGHRSPYGYHTLECLFLPCGKKARCLVWHDTNDNDIKSEVKDNE